jgi:selenocysteine lyase/cysteine desulfurase
MEEREDIKLSIVTPRYRFITSDDFVEALIPRTRLVSVSNVRFDTGAMLDAPRLPEACRKNATFLLLDVNQSCGSCPLTDCVNGFPPRAELQARLSDHAGGAGALKLRIVAHRSPISGLANRKPRRRIAGGRIRIAPHLMNSEEKIDRLLTVTTATTERCRECSTLIRA